MFCTGTAFYMITLETIDESLRSEKTRIVEFGHPTLLGDKTFRQRSNLG